MATESRVILDDSSGALARLGGVLGEAGVNIDAIQAMSGEGRARVHFVPNDPERAAAALDAAEIPYTRREVLVVAILDQPGALGDVALVMARAGITVDSVYATAAGQVALGVDDLSGAVHVASGMAVIAPR